MRWTEDVPGAGDTESLLGVARALDRCAEATHTLAGDVWDATAPIGPDTWAGNAADAWTDAAGTAHEIVRRLVQDMQPAIDALTDYAHRVEEIADEAAAAGRNRAAALGDLDAAARRAVPSTDPLVELRRQRTADDDRRAIERRAAGLLDELADRRRAPDRAVLAGLGAIPAGDWTPVGRITVPSTVVQRPVAAAVDAVGSGSALAGAWSMPSQSEDLRRFLDASWQEPWNDRIRVRNEHRALDARRSFTGLDSDGGRLGRAARSRFPDSIGKVASPRVLNVVGRGSFVLGGVMGAVDTVTGGGYDGARGWATRGFGLAGMTGSLALVASLATGIAFTLTPVGAAIAMGAVLAYTAWSIGNLVWDHRETIGGWFTAAGRGIRGAADRAREGVAAAGSWLGDRVRQAVSRGLAPLGRSPLRVPRLGLP